MDGDGSSPVFRRTGIAPKQNYMKQFPLPRRSFQRDHLNGANNHEHLDNSNGRIRHQEDNLRSKMKKNRQKRNLYRRHRNSQSHTSVQERINAIRNSHDSNNRFPNGNNYYEDANSSHNHTMDDSNDSVDMGKFQFNVRNLKKEQHNMDHNNLVDVDVDDDDDDEQIDDATDLTVQVVNDKATTDSEQHVCRFKMALDARAQLSIKKIQSRNRHKQVIYPYPVTPHQTGLTTHERFSRL